MNKSEEFETSRQEEELEIVDAFRRGRPEAATRAPNASTVLSVRVTRTVLTALTAEAKKRNVPVGRLAR